MKDTSNTKQRVNNIRNKVFNKYQAVLKIRHNISRGYIESFTQQLKSNHSLNIETTYEDQSFRHLRPNIQSTVIQRTKLV